MPPSLFSPLPPRWCGWCQSPLQGRSDKLFCSAACRGMAARHGAGDEDRINWPERAIQAEQTVHALQAQLAQLQQAAAPFDHRYDELSQVIGVFVPDIVSLGGLANLLDYVGRLVRDYQRHPGLASGHAVAAQRLQNLQRLHATLARQHTALQVGQSAALGGPGSLPSTQTTETPPH